MKVEFNEAGKLEFAPENYTEHYAISAWLKNNNAGKCDIVAPFKNTDPNQTEIDFNETKIDPYNGWKIGDFFEREGGEVLTVIEIGRIRTHGDFKLFYGEEAGQWRWASNCEKIETETEKDLYNGWKIGDRFKHKDNNMEAIVKRIGNMDLDGDFRLYFGENDMYTYWASNCEKI